MREHNEAARNGRPKAKLVLSETERDQLTALTMRRKTAQALALRVRIVLACADGIDDKAVAAKLRVTQQTGVEVARALRTQSAGWPGRICAVAQSGRTLVRHAHREIHTTWNASLDTTTRRGHPALPRRL
ncbi:protein of unknown function [Burkholderia multivorans]